MIMVIVMVAGLGGCQAETSSPPTITTAPTISTPTPVPEATTSLINTVAPTLTATPPMLLPTTYDGPLPDRAQAVLGIGGIRGYALSPHGVYLALQSGLGLGIYNTDTFEQRWFHVIYDTNSRTLFDSTVRWSPDGSKVALQNPLEVTIFDIVSGEQLARLNSIEIFTSPYATWGKIGWSADSSILGMEIATYLATWDARTNRIDPDSRVDQSLFKWLPDGVEFQGTSPSSDAYLLESGVLANGVNVIMELRPDGSLTMWDANSNKPLHSWVQTPYSEIIGWSADGAAIALFSESSETNKVESSVWNTATGALLNYSSDLNPESFISTAANQDDTSPDGSRNVDISYCELALTLTDTNTNKVIQRMSLDDCCEGFCLPYSWSPDSRLLFATWDGNLYVWSAVTGQLIDRVEGPGYGELLSFSPDGSLLAIEAHGSVVLWKIPR